MADFELDHAGIAQLLKSPAFAKAVNAQAQAIAMSVRQSTSVPVVVDQYTTDRSAASVTIAHPSGMGLQAKNGVLTRAAAAVGLEVNAR